MIKEMKLAKGMYPVCVLVPVAVAYLVVRHLIVAVAVVVGEHFVAHSDHLDLSHHIQSNLPN